MRFVINSFKSGKSDYDDRGIAGSFKDSKNLNVRGDEDTLSCNQALVADGTGASGADTIVTDLVLFFVNGSDGNTYGFGDSGKIYKRTSAAVWSLVYTDADGRITGAYEWYIDNGKRYMCWATATKFHTKEMPGNTGWSDVDADITPLSTVVQHFPKTDLTSATWHTMTQANGSLMICNDKDMAMFGYDASWTKQALTLRPGIISKTVIEYGNQVLIGGGDGVRESWLSTWEQTALSWIAKNRIPSKTINAICQAELTLMSAGDNELFFTDMTNNVPVCFLDGKADPGGTVEQGGLALFGLFGGSYSGIWSYGRKKKNENYTLNLENYLDADEIGALCKISGQVFVSYQKGATHGVKKVDTATKAVAEYYSLHLTMPKESTVQSIELVSDPIPAGCSIAVYYQMDESGTWTQAYMADEVTTATEGIRDPIFNVGSYGRDIDLKIVLTPNVNTTPTIEEIYVNFI